MGPYSPSLLPSSLDGLLLFFFITLKPRLFITPLLYYFHASIVHYSPSLLLSSLDGLLLFFFITLTSRFVLALEPGVLQTSMSLRYERASLGLCGSRCLGFPEGVNRLLMRFEVYLWRTSSPLPVPLRFNKCLIQNHVNTTGRKPGLSCHGLLVPNPKF